MAFLNPVRISRDVGSAVAERFSDVCAGVVNPHSQRQPRRSSSHGSGVVYYLMSFY